MIVTKCITKDLIITMTSFSSLTSYCRGKPSVLVKLKHFHWTLMQLSIMKYGYRCSVVNKGSCDDEAVEDLV